MTISFYPTDGNIGIDFSERTDGTTTDGESAKFTLGSRVTGNKSSVWVYVQAGSAISQYDYVTIDENYQAIPGTQAALEDGHLVGFAQAAFDDNDFGWVALSGTGLSVNAASGCAADAVLYNSATAGRVDDASSISTVAAARVGGVTLVSTADSSTVTACGAIASSTRAATF